MHPHTSTHTRTHRETHPPILLPLLTLLQIHRALKPTGLLTILTDDEGYANVVAKEIMALSEKYVHLYFNSEHMCSVNSIRWCIKYVLNSECIFLIAFFNAC